MFLRDLQFGDTFSKFKYGGRLLKYSAESYLTSGKGVVFGVKC